MNRKKALLKDLRSPFAKSFLSAIQNISELESKSPIVVENQSIKENIDCIRIKIRNDSLSQYPKYDIKNEEILDIEFDCRDENIPKVYIVRKDFPLIAHTLIDEDDRLYLCLYENSWDDIRLSWNPRDFIRRLLIWFNDAAQGKLHREAQPLEAYIFPYCNAHLILPSDLLFGLKEGKLFGPIEFNNCFQVNNDLYAYPNKGVTSKAVFLSLNFPERANLGVSKMPKTLGDLASIIDFNEVKLYDLINNAFQSNEFNSIEDENVHLWLILNLSLSRADDGVSEKIVKVAVRICNSLPDLLRDYGIFEIDPESKKYVKLLHTDIKEDVFKDTRITLWNIHILSSKLISLLNGHNSFDKTLLCVGCGALGSHIIANLNKSKFGNLKLIDKDIMLPHNIAKHFLSKERSLMSKKSTALSSELNLQPSSDLPYDITKDFKKIAPYIDKSSTILDFSASAYVERFLSRYITTNRIISAYLNPSGSMMILHAEDSIRSHPIDYVEHIFYGNCLELNTLEDTFKIGEQIQIAARCSDITNIVPNDNFEIFAGLASKKIKEILTKDAEAATYIFKLTDSLAIESIKCDVPEYKKCTFEEFSCMISASFIKKIQSIRDDNLPNEIGGTIIGNYDNYLKRYYLIDTLPSPPDSLASMTWYERGKEDNQANLERVISRSGGYLKSIGEWHSHPDNVSVRMSETDNKAYSELSRFESIDGYSPVMFIMGEKGNCLIRINNFEENFNICDMAKK